MTCREFSAEIVETARLSRTPGEKLAPHLEVCDDCRQRWKAERNLSAHFRVMKSVASAANQSRPDQTFRRAQLMQAFAKQNAPQPKSHRWMWALSVAATAILAVGGVRFMTERLIVNLPHADDIQFSRDAAELSAADFIAVPYAPPLAQGEIVRVVRTELYPGALATMGIEARPDWKLGESGNLPADVVVGQDGFPRAVRYVSNTDVSDF